MRQIFFLSVIAISLLVVSCSATAPTSKAQLAAGALEYQPKDYSYLLGMQGFNDDLLKMHFKLYEGYVKNTNLISAELGTLSSQNKDRSYDYGALKRRWGWEFDGMRLHELYFDNLGGKGVGSFQTDLLKQINAQFGSFDAWKKDFIATGMMRGIGWSLLCKDNKTGRLFNIWINEHDLGHFATATILLVLDVFEHAYITQYGLDREAYIQAFFNNIDWNIVNARWQASLGSVVKR